jgi:hypothetical protein
MKDKINNIMNNFVNRRLFIVLISGFLFFIADAHVCFPAYIDSVPNETFSDRVTGRNGFSWNSGYDIELKDGTLFVHVAVNLIPVYSVTKLELDRVIPSWKAGIERIWSGKFALEAPSGQRYPIVMSVTFKGRRFHHEVIVRRGRGRTDELNWNLLDSPEIVAHEFGHIVGAFDEYRRGATAPQREIIDSSSIMTGNPAGGLTYARHYEIFRLWFIKKTGMNDVSLLRIITGQTKLSQEMSGSIAGNKKGKAF